MKILILGGYGTFGGRLADLLLGDSRLKLYIAGRNLAAAKAFCSARAGTAMAGAAKLVPAQLDRMAAGEVLHKLKPDLVVDASGPFQLYGDDPYGFARVVLESGADYIDLADGAEFVRGIAGLDALAMQHERFALSGMSSFPVLAAAVVRNLAAGQGDIRSIAAGIAPSPFAGVGLNVIKAIASYAGKPIAVLEDGQWTTRSGFFDSRRMSINVPGEVPLPPIRFALAEVPDLRILAEEWPGIRSVWVGAGPTPAVLHRLLWLAAGLVKWRVLPSLLPLAPVMNAVVNHVRWGEHRGGMVVDAAFGTGRRRSWHLLAEGDGGPLIPSMAAAAVVHRCLGGRRPAAGARPGHRDLELEDYAPLLARHGIKTGIRNESSGASLYQAAMGDAFSRLAPPLQHLHRGSGSLLMRGKAQVSRGSNAVTRLAGWLFGFPAAGDDIDVEVSITAVKHFETWTRRFAGKTFQSTQEPGCGCQVGLIVERFGPFGFGMAVIEREGGLQLILRNWTFLGLSLPRWAMPYSKASEHDAGQRFNFDVEIGLPVFGKIVHYCGWLAEAEPQ